MRNQRRFYIFSAGMRHSQPWSPSTVFFQCWIRIRINLSCWICSRCSVFTLLIFLKRHFKTNLLFYSLEHVYSCNYQFEMVTNDKNQRRFYIFSTGMRHSQPLSPSPVPEIIDTVFAKTSPIRSFSITEYERFGLVFTKSRVYKFGHWFLFMLDPDLH